ncbi:Auxin-induced protein 22D [Apostasia shenzhenica]|uniref:Auxin-responsive protein n=1 Tax=Apostasia shenzhenica TaxID=1088818 RepID=A0A2I0B1M5_9ASPA|nr:Auxin-induced protein 22D [Apostasia shenzhenica]
MEAADRSDPATELRLGLPGSASRGGKRAISMTDEAAPPATKAQAVGWPPVRSYRRNSFPATKKGAKKDDSDGADAGIYVKVGMDGAPYLRKIDLKIYSGYEELRDGVETMFNCFTFGGCDHRPEYVMAFEDKDGDWMMVGDVPWEMFIRSCKRLRIMKGSDARGVGSGSSALISMRQL